MNKESWTTGRVALLVVLAGVTVATWVSPLDQRAATSLEAGTKRALITFGTARALNAAVSVAQGTELTVNVGVGAILSVGEVLDPINDLVEQFADLMLLASVSFGVQQLLLAMGQHGAVKLILTVLLVGWAAWYATRRVPPPWLSSLLVLALMARFAIPAASVGAELVFQGFLQDRYRVSEQVVSETTQAVRDTGGALEAAQDEAAPEEGGWWRGIMGNLDVQSRLDRLKSKVGYSVDHIVQLIVVFVVQTLIVPLLVLWALYIVARNLLATVGRDAVGGRSREAGPARPAV